jgi:hypothetical protein
MNLTYKLRRIKPQTVILNFSDRPPIQLDFEHGSTQSLMKIIRDTHWEDLEAFMEGNMILKVRREEVDELREEDDEPELLNLPTLPDLPDVDARTEPFVAPERWLQLMIHAQQSASVGERQTIQLLLETMKDNNDRSQDLLTQAHNMIVAQQEQIATLAERVYAEPDEKDYDDSVWESRVGRIVEGLAPIVAPLLMRASQGQQAQPQAHPATPPALPPPEVKKGKK